MQVGKLASLIRVNFEYSSYNMVQGPNYGIRQLSIMHCIKTTECAVAMYLAALKRATACSLQASTRFCLILPIVSSLEGMEGERIPTHICPTLIGLYKVHSATIVSSIHLHYTYSVSRYTNFITHSTIWKVCGNSFRSMTKIHTTRHSYNVKSSTNAVQLPLDSICILFKPPTESGFLT